MKCFLQISLFALMSGGFSTVRGNNPQLSDNRHVATQTAAYNADRGFIHPGALHTQEDFDRVKAQLAAGDATVTAAFNLLKANAYAQPSVATYPTETIIRGGTGENYMNAARGAAMAYQNALMWKLTGEIAYANGAVRILNAWKNTCTGIGGDSNYALAAGIYGYEFANAAELMRDYEGWSSTDFADFQTWMMTVWYPKAIGFLRSRNGTWENAGKWWQAPGHYWSNWGLCNTLCVMSIGILCDDVYIYNQGVSFYKYDHVGTFKNLPETDNTAWNWGLNEFIGNLVPVESNCPDSLVSPFGKISQMQESGRDQGHATMALGLAVDICQTGLNQGDDLFTLMNDRLAGGIEHVAAYNFAGKTNLPFAKYRIQTSGYTLADGRGGTHTADWGTGGNTRPYWARVLGYYEGIRGVKMTYSEAGSAAVGIDGGGGNYGQTSGGFDHLGFSTLMCTRPATTADKAPTPITPALAYGGTTYQRAELGGLSDTYQTKATDAIPAGSVVTLMPTLPDGTTDTGNWRWNTGETTRELQIIANISSLYRVTYTNANGVPSSQMFSIAVKGDCRADVLTPYITTSGITVNDTIISTKPSTAITLGANNAAGYGTYRWNTGATTSSISLQNLRTDSTFSMVYTNQGGAESVIKFQVKMIWVTPSIAVDGGEAQAENSVIVNRGQSITLMPMLSDESAGTWAWDNGNATLTQTLSNVQTSGTYTFIYTLNSGEQIPLKFEVYVANDTPSTLTDGDYYIKNASTGEYLTNMDTTQPKFQAENDENTQLWNITKDGDRYKITSGSSGAILTEYATLKQSGYTAANNTFEFYGVDGNDRYAIRNGGAAGTAFWLINSTNGITGKGTSALQGYPFEIVPANLTGIGAANADNDVRVYPSVVHDVLTVCLPESASSGARLTLISFGGAVAKRASCTPGINTIKVSHLPNGIYFAVIQFDKMSKSFKILKR